MGPGVGPDPPPLPTGLLKEQVRVGVVVLSLSCSAPSTGEQHFPEALQLVKEQELYAEALRLYATDGAPYKVTPAPPDDLWGERFSHPAPPPPQALSCAYAEHLAERRQAEQAGLLLWRCGELPGALRAFVSGCSWRNAVCVAQQIPLPPEHLALLARDLAGDRGNGGLSGGGRGERPARP